MGQETKAGLVLCYIFFLFDSDISKCDFTFFYVYFFFHFYESSTVVSRAFVGIGIFSSSHSDEANSMQKFKLRISVLMSEDTIFSNIFFQYLYSIAFFPSHIMCNLSHSVAQFPISPFPTLMVRKPDDYTSVSILVMFT